MVIFFCCLEAFADLSTHTRVNKHSLKYLHLASKVSKTLFMVPTDAHYHKIIEMLKQHKNYNTCSDMFRFTQKPSSGSSPVLAWNYIIVFFPRLSV